VELHKNTTTTVNKARTWHKNKNAHHESDDKNDVPVAMERGGSSGSEVVLDNIQRKCQVLLKAMQKADRNLYILPFKDSGRPLNGNCSTIMKHAEFPSDFDDIVKYSPEFYLGMESRAMFGKWLLAHDAPFQHEPLIQGRTTSDIC
jgi:hypothetical protein